MENVIQTVTVSESGRWGRSSAAVLAGLVTIVVTHTAADAVMHGLGVFPRAGQPMSDALFGLATTYRVLLSIAGAYVTAVLAPRNSLKHTLVLGAIGVVLSSLGLVVRIVKGPELGPLWYPLLLVLFTLPCCWLGARLQARRAALRNAR
jgi:hypothetical protein